MDKGRKNIFSEVFKVLRKSIVSNYRHISELKVFQNSWREPCVNEIHKNIADKNLLLPFVLLINSPANHSILQLLRDIPTLLTTFRLQKQPPEVFCKKRCS